MILNSFHLNLLFTFFGGYLFGSLPTGYLVCQWIKGMDIRTLGSGSTGATNVLRQVGKGPALIVFLIDVLKGIAPVLIAKTYFSNEYLIVVTGTAALAGHIWPIWLKWKGGKAVATGLGVLLGISWSVGIACLGIFLLVLLITKIVSLSSIVAALSLPPLMVLILKANSVSHAYLIISLFAMAMVLWRHRSNFSRLIKGTEPQIGKGSN